MQPLQCVLQHLVYIHAAITMKFASPHCKTPRENRLTSKQSKPQPPHKEAPFIAGSYGTRKNTRFCAPASSPTQGPCNIHAAITMHFAAPNTHPCSHYHAVCIHSLQNNRLTSKQSKPRPKIKMYSAKSPKSLTFLGIFGPADLHALARCHPYRNISSSN